LVLIFAGYCARSSTDRASDYGSEGLGFESLRARNTLVIDSNFNFIECVTH
jgi:hypothetical protein